MGDLFAQYYEYNYNDVAAGTDFDAVTILAISGGMLLIAFGIMAVLYVICAFLLSLIFKKAGVEPWKAWVPGYNIWIVLELGGQQGFWAILLLFPPLSLIGLVFLYIALHHMGRKLGKPDAFVLLGIFFPLVWLIWLAFDTSKWSVKKNAKKAAKQ